MLNKFLTLNANSGQGTQCDQRQSNPAVLIWLLSAALPMSFLMKQSAAQGTPSAPQYSPLVCWKALWRVSAVHRRQGVGSEAYHVLFFWHILGSWCTGSPHHDREELPLPRRDTVQADAEVAGPGAAPCLHSCTDLCPCVLGVTLQQPGWRLHLGPDGGNLHPDDMQGY